MAPIKNILILMSKSFISIFDEKLEDLGRTRCFIIFSPQMKKEKKDKKEKKTVFLKGGSNTPAVSLSLRSHGLPRSSLRRRDVYSTDALETDTCPTALDSSQRLKILE